MLLNDFLAPILTKVPTRCPNGATVEYGRLVRAIGIVRAGMQDEKTIHCFGPQQFRVIGKDQPWYDVDLTGDQRCYCKDAQFSPYYDRMCKHEMACRLINQEQGMLTHMMEVVFREEQRKKEAA